MMENNLWKKKTNKYQDEIYVILGENNKEIVRVQYTYSLQIEGVWLFAYNDIYQFLIKDNENKDDTIKRALKKGENIHLIEERKRKALLI